MKFSVATNWNDRLLPGIISLNNNKEKKIIELFGSLPTGIFGHARQTVRIPNISKEIAEKSIREIKNNGILFNYLINSSTFPVISDENKLKEAINYLQWIKNQKVDIITIGNEKTLRFVKKYIPEIPVNLSIVMAIKTVREAERIFNLHPNIKRITPHQSINRDKEELSAIISASHNRRIEVELLANEICVYDCPKMKDHYIFMSKTTQHKESVNFKPVQWCQQINTNDKLSFLNACWIRPEDIILYENIGVDIIKLSGRNETTEYLLSTVKSYLEEKFEGNALNLFYQSFWRKQIPYYDNSKLSGFIEYLWKNGLKKIDRIPMKYDFDIKQND